MLVFTQKFAIPAKDTPHDEETVVFESSKNKSVLKILDGFTG